MAGSFLTTSRSVRSSMGLAGFQASSFPAGGFQPYSFPMPGAADRSGCFYLVGLGNGLQALTGAAFQQFCLLPDYGTYSGHAYMLAVVYMTTAEHAALQVIAPQPSGWTGTVAEALAFLRSNDLIHHWWLFETFLSRTGLLDSGEVRAV